MASALAVDRLSLSACFSASVPLDRRRRPGILFYRMCLKPCPERYASESLRPIDRLAQRSRRGEEVGNPCAGPPAPTTARNTIYMTLPLSLAIGPATATINMEM